MPSDARSLLKAATQERSKTSESGITDPFASYNPASGALRCSACNYLAIKHENLWAAHIVSKSHRTNVARIRSEQALKFEQEKTLQQSQALQTKDGKRKAVDKDESTSADSSGSTADGSVAKKARNLEEAKVDNEWERFKRQLESGDKSEVTDEDQRYNAEAIIEVQPQLLADADTRLSEAEGEDEQELIAARERKRQEQDEREEILSRYEEEQRIQDEADERCVALN